MYNGFAIEEEKPGTKVLHDIVQTTLKSLSSQGRGGGEWSEST